MACPTQMPFLFLIEILLSDFAAGVELVILATGSEEFVVGATLDDAASLQHNNAVTVAYC